MANQTQPTGNPVFDFKSSFRTTAQSIQRVLFLSALLELAAGLFARFVTLENEELNEALRYAPLMGLASLVGSGVWGFAWRSRLRREFQTAFGPTKTPAITAPDA